jgi:hypothetical protein
VRELGDDLRLVQEAGGELGGIAVGGQVADDLQGAYPVGAGLAGYAHVDLAHPPSTQLLQQDVSIREPTRKASLPSDGWFRRACAHHAAGILSLSPSVSREFVLVLT